MTKTPEFVKSGQPFDFYFMTCGVVTNQLTFVEYKLSGREMSFLKTDLHFTPFTVVNRRCVARYNQKRHNHCKYQGK
jgi:hypothetical protein